MSPTKLISKNEVTLKQTGQSNIICSHFENHWVWIKVFPPLPQERSVGVSPKSTSILNLLALAGDDQKRQFMEEIEMMKKLGQHKNIVNMVACCTNKEPFLLVVEYVPNGDLLNYLRKIRLQVRMT